MLGRYDAENVREWISGYVISDKSEEGFDRAKKECIKAFETYLVNIKEITFEQFKSRK